MKNKYLTIGPELYHQEAMHDFKDLKVTLFNDDLAKDFPIFHKMNQDDFLNFIKEAANKDSCIALAYAGRQFGHFVPRLGDGRALLLGQIMHNNGLEYDIQLKGSGRTLYSRGGDGLCPLGPAIREYLVSEAMHSYGASTARVLAVFTTGEQVYRDSAQPGAVVVRIARSHVRVGSFEFLARHGHKQTFHSLLSFCKTALYDKEMDDMTFFSSVAKKQAQLISDWLSVGFIHGVMNTDNMLISGETIDYGPCAFMDTFQKKKVFSSIDTHGRYSYTNQVPIMGWNLARLAECLLWGQSSEGSETQINEYQNIIHQAMESAMEKHEKKTVSYLGLKLKDQTEIRDFHKAWLNQLEVHNIDFHIAHQKPRSHTSLSEKFHQTYQLPMETHYPIVIARNHIVEKIIDECKKDNYCLLKQFLSCLKNPQTCTHLELFTNPPTPAERVYQTFCGT